MKTNMQQSVATKNGTFIVDRGNLRLVVPERQPTPEQLLDNEMQEICSACKVRRPTGTLGGYATRAVADVAQWLRFPLRVIGRMIADVIVAGGPDDFTDRICAALSRFAHRKAHQLGRGRNA